jgi:hypothetical protein
MIPKKWFLPAASAAFRDGTDDGRSMIEDWPELTIEDCRLTICPKVYAVPAEARCLRFSIFSRKSSIFNREILHA